MVWSQAQITAQITTLWGRHNNPKLSAIPTTAELHTGGVVMVSSLWMKLPLIQPSSSFFCKTASFLMCVLLLMGRGQNTEGNRWCLSVVHALLFRMLPLNLISFYKSFLCNNIFYCCLTNFCLHLNIIFSLVWYIVITCSIALNTDFLIIWFSTIIQTRTKNKNSCSSFRRGLSVTRDVNAWTMHVQFYLTI